MAVSPWYVGQTNPAWVCTFPPGVDLTGATVTVRWQLVGGNAVAGGGTLTLKIPTSGVFTYAPAAGDTSQGAGTYLVQFKAVFADNSVMYCDPISLTVSAAV